jgi:hypothetical protein
MHMATVCTTVFSDIKGSNVPYPQNSRYEWKKRLFLAKINQKKNFVRLLKSK